MSDDSGNFYTDDKGKTVYHIVGKSWRQKLFAGDTYGYHEACGTNHWRFDACPGYGTTKIHEIRDRLV